MLRAAASQPRAISICFRLPRRDYQRDFVAVAIWLIAWFGHGPQQGYDELRAELNRASAAAFADRPITHMWGTPKGAVATFVRIAGSAMLQTRREMDCIGRPVAGGGCICKSLLGADHVPGHNSVIVQKRT